MPLTPTDEQQAIIKQAVAGGNLMIQAYAGTAKTTTAEMMAQAMPRVGALAVAFNKKIAVELQRRLPSHFLVKTLNGLGHAAWAKALGKNLTLDDRKLGKLVSEVFKEMQYRANDEAWDSVRRLVTVAMNHGLVPTNIPHHKGMIPDNKETWADLAADAWIPADERQIELAREVLIRSINASYGIGCVPTISFDDQIYCSAMLGGVFGRFPLVLVDEAQDLSPLNHRQLQRAAQDRIIAVGDKLQSIYAFRGADTDSFGKIEALRPSWVHKPLTLTFRCPKVVVARQQEHAPGFRAFSENAEGKFTRWMAPEDTESTWPGWGWSDIKRELDTLNTTSCAILCRNNAPLLALAFKLLRKGVPVHMLGRDIGKGLMALAKKISPESSTGVDTFRALVLDWMARERTLADANGKPERGAAIEDRGQSLLAVADFSGATDVRGVREALEKLFNRESGVVILSTIHRAKGLEYQLVIHLDPWRIPSRFAREQAKAGDNRQMQQELNLKYVCETRSQHTLVNANSEDFSA